MEGVKFFLEVGLYKGINYIIYMEWMFRKSKFIDVIKLVIDKIIVYEVKGINVFNFFILKNREIEFFFIKFGRKILIFFKIYSYESGVGVDYIDFEECGVIVFIWD